MVMNFLPATDYSVEILYTFVITACTLVMWRRTKSLYELSGYKGIQYFSTAMLFFALAYGVRFIRVTVQEFWTNYPEFIFQGLDLVFFYLLASAGLLITYSLVWKRLTPSTGRHFMLYVFAAGFAIIEVFAFPTFTYLTQLVVFGYAILLTYRNYLESRRKLKTDFRQMYFIVFLLSFAGYFVNYLAVIYRTRFSWIVLFAYVFTVALFILLLYIVLKVTEDHG
jgi:hypothetical protein